MIHVGCCSYNFRGLNLEDSLKLTASLGFKYANIGAYDDSHPVPPSLILTRPEAIGKEIRNGCAKYGITPVEFFICSVSTGNIGGEMGKEERVWPNDPDKPRREKMLEAFKKVCACAAEAGLRNIMGVPGLEGLNPAPDEGLSVSVETLAQMLEIAKGYNVALTIEPHTGSITATPEKVLNLIKQVPGLTLSLDHTHFIGTGHSVEAILPLHEYASHLHGKPANKNATKCLFYEGEDFFTPVLRDFVKRNWEGVIAVECMYPVDAPNLTSHPAFQTVLTAGHIAKVLDGLR